MANSESLNVQPRTGAAGAIVEFFDQRAADYDREYAEETPAGYALRVRRRKVLELFDRSGGDVLDVGCGPGVMTEELLNRGCRFWGVDPSANMIAIGRTRFGESDRVHFLQGDAEGLEFADDTFDAVFCMGVIDSVPDGPKAIQEMVRVLKPGGTLILTFTNLLNPYAWWKNYVFYPAVETWHRLRGAVGDPTIRPGRVRSGNLRALYSRGRAERLVQLAGGQVLHVAPCYFNLFISPLDELVPRVALRVTRRIEERGAPEWLAAGLILKARKS
jgi:ubiquinone/menaquinone biosynthesis C-methylase UbiE